MRLVTLEVIAQANSFAAGALIVTSWQVIGRPVTLMSLQALGGCFFACSYFMLGDTPAALAAISFPVAFVWSYIAEPHDAIPGGVIWRGGAVAIVSLPLAIGWLITTTSTAAAAAPSSLMAEFAASYVSLAIYLALARRGEAALRTGMPICVVFWLANNVAAHSIGGIILNLTEIGSMAIAAVRIRSTQPATAILIR